MLYFSKANTKLKKLEKELKAKVYSFDLLSGWSCPFAERCKSFAIKTPAGLRIKDEKNIWFRCFSASQEVLYPCVYKRRLENFNLVKKYHSQPKLLVNLLHEGIPPDANVIRYHVAGDFFYKYYMWAAIQVAIKNPHIVFYTYTKAVKWWGELRGVSPSNFRVTISIGGKQDKYIDSVTARVINMERERDIWNLPIDYNDSHAFHNNEDFLLLIHGTQPNVKNLL
jgi:hypothetical protein